MKIFILLGLSTAGAFLANQMGFVAPQVFVKSGATAVAHVPSQELDVLKSPTAISPKKIWVEGEADFYKNETIELRFAAPNAPFLGVTDPADRKSVV